MITLQQFSKQKPLPSWMIHHPAFKLSHSVEKIFPNIGLKNSEEPCEISGNFATDEARNFLKNVCAEITAPFDAFEATKRYSLMALIQQLENILSDYTDQCLHINKNGEIDLKLPVEVVVDDKPLYLKNTDIISVYADCVAQFATVGWALPYWEKIPGYKEFIANNVSSNKTSIVFASDGVDGLWDIATMSMRGIKSCVRWDGQHKLTLIGSILDPFTGIIYLTSNKEEKLGRRMIKRCIVRFVVNSTTKKPYLLIDRMYPSLSYNVLKSFKDFISAKTKLDICFGPEIPLAVVKSSYIPKPHLIDNLTEKTLPYRDTKICVGKIPSKVSERKNSNIAIKKHNLSIKLKQSISYLDCLKAIQEAPVSKILNTADFQYLIENYTSSIVDKLFNGCEQSTDKSSHEFAKQACYNYFINKKIISKAENDKFTRALNKYYANRLYLTNYDRNLPAPKAPAKILQKELKPMFDYMLLQISKTIKSEILKLIHSEATNSKKTTKGL